MLSNFIWNKKKARTQGLLFFILALKDTYIPSRDSSLKLYLDKTLLGNFIRYTLKLFMKTSILKQVFDRWSELPLRNSRFIGQKAEGIEINLNL